MTGPRVWAVVLVKPLRLAKRRLGPLLGPVQRFELACTMLEDVLDAVAAARARLAVSIVVTADETAADLAARRGAVVLREVATGMNAALTQATAYVVDAHGDGVIVIPGDLPHVSPRAIAMMVDLLAAPRAVAVVESHDGGTNMLACRPAAVIRPAFGDDSGRRHCAAARAAGITPAVLAEVGLERDIDAPDDVVSFLSLGSPTRTHAYLARLVAGRLWGSETRSEVGTYPLAAAAAWTRS